MSKTGADFVTVDINEMLKSFSWTPSKPTMFRVGDNLRSENPRNFDPTIIAIGPFHHRKPHLRNMEKHKVRYLKLFLERREGSSVERYVTAIKHLEDEARKCYAEDIDLDKDEFVNMLILDGCFIIEFLYMFQYKEFRDRDDPIFQHVHLQSRLLHDLMLFENQIPFFIIVNLFGMIKTNDGDKYNIKSLIWPLLQNCIFRVRKKDFLKVPINGHHLLGIVHDLNSVEELKEAGISSKNSEGDSFFHKCSSFAKILSKMNSGNPGNPNNMQNINSGEELKEAGISSKKSEGEELKEAGSSSKESKCSFAKLLSKINSGNPNNMVNINSCEDLKEAGSSSKKSEGDSFFHKCSSFAKILSKMNSGNPGEPNNMVNINSAEKLIEAGISFKKLDANSLFDIKFENKVMKIPEWKIVNSTKSLFQNLLAYEYYITGSPQKYVTDYVFFMQCLVHSPEDAKLLRSCGIISSFLGSDEMVYRFINQLGKNIILSDKFSYSKIFNCVKIIVAAKGMDGWQY